MLFNSALISTLLLVSGVLADRRYQHHRSLSTKQHTSNPSYTILSNPDGSGVVLSEPSGGIVHSATGTFNIPRLTSPSGSFLAATVGIDLGTCDDESSLTLSVVMQVTGHGTSYAAEALFNSDASYIFPNFAIDAGDEVTLHVSADSPQSAYVKIENNTKQQSAQQHLTSAHSLCLANAVFMILPQGQGGVPLAKFSDVTVKNIRVGGVSGTYTLDNSADTTEVYNMVRGGKTIAKTTIISGSSFITQYV